MDEGCECSVLPQPSPTRLFRAKIPAQRTRQLKSERRPSSSSAHGDGGQRCWAWHQKSTSLLRVAAPSRGTAQTSQIPALLPHTLPQLLPTQEYVPVLHAKDKPKGRPGSAGPHRAQILRLRQAEAGTQHPTVPSLYPVLLLAGSLPSHTHRLEAREDAMHQLLPASHNLLLLTLK